MPKLPSAVAALSAGLGPPANGGSAGRPARVIRDRAQMLSNVPLFAGLSGRHLNRLAKEATEMRVPPGAVIVQAGRPGKAFHVIVEGRAKVVRGVAPGGRKVAGLGPGEYFGELALLDGGPRTASGVAETSVETIRLSRTAFRKMLTSEPEIAVRVLEKMASMVRRESSPPSE
jgi:CRP/FNR family transcriptional regulator, cyclic AMP receptor protein